MHTNTHTNPGHALLCQHGGHGAQGEHVVGVGLVGARGCWLGLGGLHLAEGDALADLLHQLRFERVSCVCTVGFWFLFS